VGEKKEEEEKEGKNCVILTRFQASRYFPFPFLLTCASRM